MPSGFYLLILRTYKIETLFKTFIYKQTSIYKMIYINNHKLFFGIKYAIHIYYYTYVVKCNNIVLLYI